MKFIYSLALLAISTYSTPHVETGDWQYYIGKPYIDTSNAKHYSEFENTPESIVSYFYASKIRDDAHWQQVVPSETEWSIRLKTKLDKYERCTFTRFRLIGKKEYAKNRLWIKVYVESEYKNEMGKQVDEVSVDLLESKWLITSVPS